MRFFFNTWRNHTSSLSCIGPTPWTGGLSWTSPQTAGLLGSWTGSFSLTSPGLGGSPGPLLGLGGSTATLLGLGGSYGPLLGLGGIHGPPISILLMALMADILEITNGASRWRLFPNRLLSIHLIISCINRRKN